jgi:hypothetical protein
MRTVINKMSQDCLQGLVEEQGLANVFDFGNGAAEVKCFGEYNFENLSQVNKHQMLRKPQTF